MKKEQAASSAATRIALQIDWFGDQWNSWQFTGLRGVKMREKCNNNKNSAMNMATTVHRDRNELEKKEVQIEPSLAQLCIIIYRLSAHCFYTYVCVCVCESWCEPYLVQYCMHFASIGIEIRVTVCISRHWIMVKYSEQHRELIITLSLLNIKNSC